MTVRAIINQLWLQTSQIIWPFSWALCNWRAAIKGSNWVFMNLLKAGHALSRDTLGAARLKYVKIRIRLLLLVRCITNACNNQFETSNLCSHEHILQQWLAYSTINKLCFYFSQMNSENKISRSTLT